MTRAERETCSARAQEADRLARRSVSADEREAYERISAVWSELAAADGMSDARGDEVEARAEAVRD